MKRILFSLALLLLFAGLCKVHGQPTSAAWTLQYALAVSQTNPTDTMVKVTVVINMNDTASLGDITIKAGGQMGASDLFNEQYTLQQTSVTYPNSPKSYTRNGNIITVTIGEFFYQKIYFEARFRDELGNSILTSYFEN